MRSLFLLLALIASITISAQDVPSYNIELLANEGLLGGENGNDCWGYVDSSGTEYAILGTTLATYIYSLEDPTAPILRARIPGVNSTWRDIKDHNEYLYVTADRGTDGVLVINMENAPDSISFSFFKPTVTVAGQTGEVGRSHNIYITDEGYMVLAGSNFYSGTPIFFDLNADPEEPPFLGASRNTYAHDVFAENNKLYSSDIYAGEMTVHDYTDPTDIVALGSATTSTTFTHNAWPTADDASAFTTDERPGAFVDGFDVSDPTTIRFLDKFRPDATFEDQSIPHNTHVLGDHLATSWYRDGVVLTDVSRPNNMIEVGIYDTYNGQGDGFDGCWGTYPFLPSGLLIASDINSGLYIFQPTYEKGCYFEGVVIDSVTREVVSGVDVNFDDRPAQADMTDIEGKFETGIYAEGDYTVTFSKLGYESKTLTVNMARGVLNMQTVELKPFNLATLTVNVVDNAGSTIPGALFSLNLLGPRAGGQLAYEIVAGRWGYITNGFPEYIVDEGATETVTIVLEEGIYDDYNFDFGWVETGTATSGKFERGAPVQTIFNGAESQLGADLDSDFGDQAYVTGNTGGGAGDNDVDNGTTTITSPVFDLSDAGCATLNFFYHFFNGGGQGGGDDAFVITLSNGTTSVTVDSITTSTNTWTAYQSAPLGDLITLTDNMTVAFSTGDLPTSGHLVETLVDRFTVVTALSADFEATVDMLSVDFNNTSEGSTSTTWDFGDGATSTMASPNHVYAAPGTYTVTLTIDGPCGTQTVTKEVTVEGASSTASPLASLGIQVIQNPVKDVLTVRNAGHDAVELELYNSLGQGVMSYRLAAGNTWSADASTLAVGTYYLAAPNKGVTPIKLSVVR